MSAIRTGIGKLWHELVRPRGHVRHRFYRGGRRSESGIALLMVISSILLLTVLVTEIARGALIRVQLAAQQRDDVKAEQLAYGGAAFHRLILIASKAIGRNEMFAMIAPMFGTNAQELWQALPYLDTRMMRLIFVNDGDVDGGDIADVKTAGGLTDEQVAESREQTSMLKRNFLDFDGDFRSDVVDEERRINVSKLTATNLGDLLQLPQAQEILAMFQTEASVQYLNRNNLVREELVGNLADWVDPDDLRIYGGGSEDQLYSRLEYPYHVKNAPFDTREEIRLVDGWHLDGVWERVGQSLTIYGSGKINVNTANKAVLTGLLMAYYQGVVNENAVMPTVDEIVKLRGQPTEDGGLYFASAEHFFDSVTTGRYLIPAIPLKPEIKNAVTSQSNTFRIGSVGEVGNARVELNMVMDFTDDATGKVLFWKIR
ncbi:MAG: general secretion pathway protein GspK [Alphaproteobacteria bacterium]|nr:general secretion pathway protein GspK [Alphaproteobacteria bacterium]